MLVYVTMFISIYQLSPRVQWFLNVIIEWIVGMIVRSFLSINYLAL